MRQPGYFIGRYPRSLIVASAVLIVPLCAFFLVHPLHIDTDVRRGFAHRNGRSMREFRAFGSFYNISSDVRLFGRSTFRLHSRSSLGYGAHFVARRVERRRQIVANDELSSAIRGK